MTLKPTSEQKHIIQHTSGPAMVHAGPGCGKTSTLALRTKSLIEKKCDPKNIVIVTYTKALALDIKKTLNKHLGEKVAKQVVVKTLHSLAFFLVKEHSKQNHAVLPTVLKRKRKRQLIAHYAKEYPLKESEISQAFYHLTLGDYSRVEKRLGKDKAKLAKSAFKVYSKTKQKQNKLDFDDMVSQALNLLKPVQGSSSILPRYHHLMVDELQDIDRPQKELLLALSRHVKSTVMVGDTSQSVYGWRHALPEHWDELAESLKPKHFKLTLSHRISQEALPLVNDIAKQIDKDAPVLRSKIKGEKPELIELLDQDDQHCWLAQEITALTDKEDKGVDPSQIAILGRTRKELSQTAIALRARGIPINEHYKSTKINRHREHLEALIQLTQLELKRIGKSSKRLNKEERELARYYIEKLWLPQKTIQHLQDRLTMKPKSILSVKSSRKDYKRIHDLSKALTKAAQLSRIESAVQCLIDATKPVLKDRNDKHHKLLLRDLIDIKVQARDCTNWRDIQAGWFALPVTDQEKGVQMTTVHGAKGQEWNYVFMINVVDGVYPRKQAKPKAQKEELRVFYVAITRHHKKLYLLQTPVPYLKLGNKTKDKNTLEISHEKSEAKPKSSSIHKKPKVFSHPSSFINIDKQKIDIRRSRLKIAFS